MKGLRGSVLLVALALLGGCTDDGGEKGQNGGADGGTTASSDEYRATISRTTDGVVHVRAGDMASAAFGQGFASFEDHGCDLADQLLKVNGQRARWFGPGENNANIDSDFAWKAIDIVGRASKDWTEADGEPRELVEGFAAGWNAALDDLGLG
ncbi:MAG TPA: penicillin acylase family protein, partial [Microthrixaceae bacterium]|nr:penicillin acylase family protein [Microthrixaceae bacterium]